MRRLYSKQRLHSRVTILTVVGMVGYRWAYWGLCKERQTGKRAYGEINRFENDLVQSKCHYGQVLARYYEEEELKRFKRVNETPNAQF